MNTSSLGLHTLDYVILAIYVVVIVRLGLWVS
ncbi:hypothetical protein CEDIAZO_03283 [Celerinatantimonas diazotrophica]|nr:hypothetical protein CEDIAZO_03283 [Celerinatantimonas diazotrophica]